MLHALSDTWHVARGMLYLASGMWHVAPVLADKLVRVPAGAVETRRRKTVQHLRSWRTRAHTRMHATTHTHTLTHTHNRKRRIIIRARSHGWSESESKSEAGGSERERERTPEGRDAVHAWSKLEQRRLPGQPLLQQQPCLTAFPTSAPGLAHICAATRPHLRRDSPAWITASGLGAVHTLPRALR